MNNLRDDTSSNFTEIIMGTNTVEETQRRIESSISTINSQLVEQRYFIGYFDVTKETQLLELSWNMQTVESSVSRQK